MPLAPRWLDQRFPRDLGGSGQVAESAAAALA
jgi:hypothetical protein